MNYDLRSFQNGEAAVICSVESIPLPSRLEGLGECREFPQRGPGRSPDRQRILGIFQRLRSLLVEIFWSSEALKYA